MNKLTTFQIPTPILWKEAQRPEIAYDSLKRSCHGEATICPLERR